MWNYRISIAQENKHKQLNKMVKFITVWLYIYLTCSQKINQFTLGILFFSVYKTTSVFHLAVWGAGGTGKIITLSWEFLCFLFFWSGCICIQKEHKICETALIAEFKLEFPPFVSKILDVTGYLKLDVLSSTSCTSTQLSSWTLISTVFKLKA